VASYAFIWQALDTGKRWYFIPHVIANILLYFTHTFALFFFMGQGLFFLLRWFKYKDLRLAWFVSQIAIIAGIFHHVWTFVLSGYAGSSSGATATGAPEFVTSLPFNNPFFTVLFQCQLIS